MSDRTKDLILKTLLVIGLILLIMIFPGTIALAFIVPDQQTADMIFYPTLFAFFGVGILFMVLLPIFGGLKRKPVKADKVPLIFDSYGEFLNYLQNRLLQKGYSVQKTTPFSSDGEVTLCVMSSRLWRLECFAIIRVSELSDELIESANDSITNILTEYYGGETITDTVNMISVFCVDRITPAFQKLVNSNLQQGIKNGRLIVGVSFGGKNIYIAKQKDGFAIAKYKQLEKHLLIL